MARTFTPKSATTPAAERGAHALESIAASLAAIENQLTTLNQASVAAAKALQVIAKKP